jgi:hypothetical protein
MVRLVIPLPAGGSVVEADQRLAELAERVAREMPRFVPD